MHQQVAALAGQAPQAAPLAAEHQRQRTAQISFVQRRLPLAREAHAPDPGLGEPSERAREVGHLDERHVLGGARRNLPRSRTETGGPIARCDDGVDPGGVGRTQAGAQVVRIGHAVEHQQQRAVTLGDQLLQRALVARGGAATQRDHALVIDPGQQRVELLARHAFACDAGRVRPV